MSVAVFAGEGSAVADDEVGGFFDELAELGDAFFRLQVEVEARVHAGVAEMSVERAFVIEGGHHFAEVAEIGAEFFGSDGGILPTFPVQRFAGDVRGRAQTGLTDFPDALGLWAGEKADVRRSGAAVEGFDQTASLRLGFQRGLAAELNHQPASAFGEQGQSFRIHFFRAVVVDQKIVEAF